MTPKEIRLAALSKLVHVRSEAVDARMGEEFAKAQTALKTGDSYSAMSEALAVLRLLTPRYHMAILPLLDAFVRSTAASTPHDTSEPVLLDTGEDASSEPLVVAAIDVAMSMRFVHTTELVDFLTNLVHAESNSVRRKAEASLEQLATLDLEYFHSRPQDGAGPQLALVTRLSGMEDEELRRDDKLIVRLLDSLLSPVMNHSSQTSYRTVTFRRGGISSAGGLAQVREAAIGLAKHLYGLNDAVSFRKSVLQTLDSATRRDGPAQDEATAAMFDGNAVAVLEFFCELVSTEALPLVQSIEHQAYWDYYHAPSEAVKRKALDVRDALARNGEYQIFKLLIGFEGIFGDWEDLKRSENTWSDTDAMRRAAAARFVQEIDGESRAAWRGRILEYAKTRSEDLATFPVFFSFLESIGTQQSGLALELLTDHFPAIEAFIIPLMRGLWASEQASALEVIVEKLLHTGENLSAVARSLYGTRPPRLELLGQVVRKASERDDRGTLVDVMGVAASLHTNEDADTRDIFMQALRFLAQHDDPRWAESIWISKDLAKMAAVMEAGDKAELAAALVHLPEVSYQAERLLSSVSGEDPMLVLNYFDARLAYDLRLMIEERQISSSERFEAIPNRLHGLGEVLAKVPQLMLATLRRHFDRPDARTLFSFRAAMLVRIVFDKVEPTLRDELLRYVRSGRTGDIAFVISILRTYDGDPGIYEICKEVVRKVPERSRVWSELAAAIETTGVVVGEFGMANALERKLRDVAEWKSDPDARVQAFAAWLGEALSSLIEQERERSAQGLALRKYRYGDDAHEGESPD